MPGDRWYRRLWGRRAPSPASACLGVARRLATRMVDRRHGWPRRRPKPIQVGGRPRQTSSGSCSRCGCVPVGTNLGAHFAQVTNELVEGRASPEPVAVVMAVDSEIGPKNEHRGDVWVVDSVSSLQKSKPLEDDALGVAQKGPTSP